MTTQTPITESVTAALLYVRNNYEEGEQWDLACHKMQSEILNQDRGRGAPQLAAAARILADEVERLREELNNHTQPQSDPLGSSRLMFWQPIETAPKDREFLAVWGSPANLNDKSVDLFRYDQELKHYVWSNYGGAVSVPTNELFAWMEIPKWEG